MFSTTLYRVSLYNTYMKYNISIKSICLIFADLVYLYNAVDNAGKTTINIGPLEINTPSCLLMDIQLDGISVGYIHRGGSLNDDLELLHYFPSLGWWCHYLQYVGSI